ncbi:MAG TPA: archaeosortase/exosortase family protein [Polyangia bacterium]|nr:archaeosortase/exosortase family protein [Polyangia bacterium]
MEDGPKAGARGARFGAGARFAVRFGGLAIALLAIYYFPYADRTRAAVDQYLALYARLAAGVLRVFDPTITVAHRVIRGRFALQIVKTCDAMDVTILLVSAILAWPGRWKTKAAAAAIATGVIFAINILRICSLYYVGIYRPSSFDFIHLEAWPAAIVLVAVAYFWLYTERTRTRPT